MRNTFILLLFLLTSTVTFGVSQTKTASKVDGAYVIRNYVKNGSFDNSVTKDITYAFGNVSGSGATTGTPSKQTGGASGSFIQFGCTDNTGGEVCYGDVTLSLETLDKINDNNSCVVEYFVFNTGSGDSAIQSIYTLDSIEYAATAITARS